MHESARSQVFLSGEGPTQQLDTPRSVDWLVTWYVGSGTRFPCVRCRCTLLTDHPSDGLTHRSEIGVGGGRSVCLIASFAAARARHSSAQLWRSLSRLSCSPELDSTAAISVRRCYGWRRAGSTVHCSTPHYHPRSQHRASCHMQSAVPSKSDCMISVGAEVSAFDTQAFKDRRSVLVMPMAVGIFHMRLLRAMESALQRRVSETPAENCRGLGAMVKTR